MSTVFFFQVGVNDEESWILIGRFSNNLYYFFDASCDYTGFDCQGGGTLAASYNWADFWNLSLKAHQREMLMAQIL